MKVLSEERGFSLIELMLVGVIVSFVVLLIYNLPTVFQLISVSNRASLAKQIANQKIEDIRARGYDNLANSQTPLVDNRLSQLPSGSGTVTIQSCPLSVCQSNEQAKLCSVEVDWTDTAGTRNVTLTTMVAKNGLK